MNCLISRCGGRSAEQQFRQTDMKTFISLLLLASLLASCVITEVSPALDRELTSTGKAFVDRHSLTWNDPNGECEWTPPQVTPRGQGGKSRIVTGPLQYKGGIGVHLPMILTLGIIPGGGTIRLEQEITIVGDMGENATVNQVYVTSYFGWLVSIFALSPNWEIGRGPDSSELDAWVFYTAINALAEQEIIQSH